MCVYTEKNCETTKKPLVYITHLTSYWLITCICLCSSLQTVKLSLRGSCWRRHCYFAHWVIEYAARGFSVCLPVQLHPLHTHPLRPPPLLLLLLLPQPKLQIAFCVTGSCVMGFSPATLSQEAVFSFEGGFVQGDFSLFIRKGNFHFGPQTGVVHSFFSFSFFFNLSCFPWVSFFLLFCVFG